MKNNFQINAIYSEKFFKVYYQSFRLLTKSVQIYSTYFKLICHFFKASKMHKVLFIFFTVRLYATINIFGIVLSLTNLILGCIVHGSLVISNGHRFSTIAI